MVPPGTGNRQLVVRQDVGPLLRLGPARSDHHRDLGDAELPGGEHASMAGNQATILAHQRRRRPAPLLDARRACASVWVRAFFAYGISRSIAHRSTLSAGHGL